MRKDEVSARARAILEEELGEIRAFADMPASAIEEMAARLTRALSPVLEGEKAAVRRSAA
jgi:hypothetical protein